MTTPELCPKCGKYLPDDAPTGLCPSCLLAAAFAVPEPDADPDGNLSGPMSGAADKFRVGGTGNIPDRFLSPTTPGTAKFVPPAAATLAPLFPQLEILGLLGHGGMGAVYKARQKKLDRLVALKIIRPEAAADPAFAERFNREARTLARLSHPHIVAVHDFGEVVADDGRTAGASTPVFYFLMEYVDGANLRELMDGRRLPSNQALAIVPQVCEALQFAHDEGVVHRDIKPENILIDSKGRVKIADFGLAKLVVGSADEFTLTGTHQVMGTPRYMAPEQMEGSHSVDHRADIYSLGVVFYEMLTGQVPAGHFDPPSKKADSDPKLDAIVLRAMAREPERRFQQASHLGSEIARAKIGNGISTSGVSFSSAEDPEATAGSPALSSFLSREARAAYRWVAGADDQSSKNTTGPRLLMLLLSLIPCAMVFFPWFGVYVTDPDATRGLEQTQLIGYRTGIAFYREYSPLELPAGMFFGVAVCMLIVSSGIAFGRRVSTVTAACIGLVLCSAPLALAMAVRANLEYSVITVFRDPATNEMPQGVLGHSNGVGTAMLAWIEHIVQYRLPFMVTVGCLFLLLCLLGIELRYAVERRSRQPRERTITNPLTNVAWWLTAGAVILAISAASSSLYFLDDPYVFDGSIRSQSEILIALIGLSGQFLCFPIFVLALLAASSLRHGEHGKLAVVACVAFFIPVTPGWFLTVPIGAWGLSVLYRQNGGFLWSTGTKAEPAVKIIRAAATPVDRVAAWLRRAAVVLIGSAVVTLVVVIAIINGLFWGNRGDEEVVMTLFAAQVFCIPLAVAAFVAASGITERRLRTLALIISGLFLLPLSPAWLMTLPVGAWSLSVLLRRDISAAFLEAEERGPDNSAKLRNGEIHGAVDVPLAGQPLSAMPSIGHPDTKQRGRAKSPHVSDTDMAIPRQENAAQPVHIADLSPLRKAWNEWWAGRNLWLTKVIQNILALAFVLSFVLFITFSTRSTVVYPTPGGPGVRATFVSFGTPSPWFEFSQNAGGTTGYGFQWRILWYSSANVVMLLGLLAYWIFWQIEKAKPDFKPSRFGSPTAVFSMVGAVAVLCIILGHLPLLLPEWNPKVTDDSQASLPSAIDADDIDRMKNWLSSGTPINQRDSNGRTPLELAITAGRERIVAFLVLRGADTLQGDAQGKIPLMLAIETGKTPVVRMLLDMEQVSHDKDIQFRMTRIDSDLKPDTDFSAMRFDVGLETADPDGVTPDMKAAALGHTGIFQMIATQRLCDGFDTMGRSWITHAIENRREAFLVEMLDEVNARIPQLLSNQGSGSRITPQLLSHTDVSGRQPLAYARELGLTAVVERIEAFCRLTIEKCDRDQAASPTYEDFNKTTRELCLKALGESE